jgi:transposase
METPATLTPGIWERTPPKAQAYIQALESRLSALEARVHALQEQNRALEERLKQTSRNSSRPPSSDPPQSPRRRRTPSGRRRGGHLGHTGHTRTLRPVEEVNEVVVHKPERCNGCQTPLWGDDPKPFRHHLIEIPPIQPVVTEYPWHQLLCPNCGETTRAPWPQGIPSGTYGPRVHATVALCTGPYRLSKRTAQQVMEEVFRVAMSVGTISPSEKVTSAVLAEPVAEARSYIPEQAVAHLDETSWREGVQRLGYGWP